MGAYNQGGGGGRAIDVTENDQFAFDQPFEIGSKFTAETANQINDMFRILFKSQTRAQTAIDAINTSTDTGSIQYVRATLTSAQLDTLNATPVILVEAQGVGTYVLPIYLSISTYRGDSTAWSAGPNYRLQHTGDTTSLMVTAIGSFLSAGAFAPPSYAKGNSVSTNLSGGHTGTSYTSLNTSLEIAFTADTNPGGAAHAVVELWYVVHTNDSPT